MIPTFQPALPPRFSLQILTMSYRRREHTGHLMRAMSPGGRLVIVDRMASSGEHAGKNTDIHQADPAAVESAVRSGLQDGPQE